MKIFLKKANFRLFKLLKYCKESKKVIADVRVGAYGLLIPKGANIFQSERSVLLIENLEQKG